ncbi:SURF1 family protein [Chitinasiproducens palmae]|uniref:SURF1 family protein n=1 Tax=Chitinasiproducens palmae TaxID=1770053 RepID=UPI000B8998DD|nr:SURF1 family protein [Chitinasiproducens palmae]
MKFRLVPVLLIAVVIAVTTALGFWQRDRAHQKEARQHQLVMYEQAPPIDLTQAVPSPRLADVEYHRVLAQGRFLADRVVYLDNRPYRDQPGFYVVMPFQLDDGRVLLVNRGWLPRNLAQRSAIAPYQTPTGTLRLEGVARADATRIYELGEAPRAGTPGEARAIRPNLPIDEYARETGLKLLPYVLMQTNAVDDGLVRDWPRPAADVDRNYGYMLQWWGMALAALLFGLFAARRAGRGERPNYHVGDPPPPPETR